MRAENNNFWMNLEKIQNALLLSDQEFSDYLGISYTHFTKQKKTLSFLPLNCVFECAEKLNFHFEDLLQENFSTKSILGKIQGNYSLHEKYSIATYSKTRQTANVLQYLEKARGEREKINFLRKFQLTEDFIFSGQHDVNILLFLDIVEYLTKTYHFTKADFFKIGQMTPFTSMNDDLREELLQKKNIYETLDYFFDELSLRFDKNYNYKITNILADQVIIEASPNLHVMEELSMLPGQFGSEQACLARMGVITSVTWFKYKRFADIEKISSLYTGDISNRYLLDISPFKKSSSLKLLAHDFQSTYH